MGLFLSDDLGAYSCGDWVLQWPNVCGKVMASKCLMSGIMVGVVERHRFWWMNGTFEHVHVCSPWFSGTTDICMHVGTMFPSMHSKLQNGLSLFGQLQYLCHLILCDVALHNPPHIFKWIEVAVVGQGKRMLWLYFLTISTMAGSTCSQCCHAVLYSLSLFQSSSH